MTLREGMHAAYFTLGCKLNFAETSSIAADLARRGIGRADRGEVPQLVVVNSCTVTAEADKKSRQLIRSVGRRWPEANIIVTGCWAQLHAEEAKGLPGVVLVAGNDRKDRIAQYVEQWLSERESRVEVTPREGMCGFSPSVSHGDRTRRFLKVQDGCNYHCSYCTIPAARGPSRSPSIESLVELAQGVALEGGREIVLTGVNIGDFGRGTDKCLRDLCHALNGVEGIERYRISSIEPNLLEDSLLEDMAEGRLDKFMHHFHIPLQSGSDRVLGLMRRRYNTGLFRSKIEKINHLMPDAFIGVDLIVGARGETDEEFERSRGFIESLNVSQLHVFPYSERPGTDALGIEGVVSPGERARRVEAMIGMSDEKHRLFSERFDGKVRKVLLEHPREDGAMEGYTDNYLRVVLSSPLPDLANRIVPMLLRYDRQNDIFQGEPML